MVTRTLSVEAGEVNSVDFFEFFLSTCRMESGVKSAVCGAATVTATHNKSVDRVVYSTHGETFISPQDR